MKEKEYIKAVKKIAVALLVVLMTMPCLTSLAEDFDFAFPPGVFDDILTHIHIVPSTVTSPQTVEVYIALKNATTTQREVTLYSPAAEQIGEPHQLAPDQTVFVTCRYSINQRTIDNGILTYFIKYLTYNEDGKEIEQSQSLRCQLNDHARNRPTATPLPTPQPTSEWPALTAAEVMYNYANSYRKDFYLKGVGELRNYYNYAYSNCEKDYFCMRVTPSGRYADSWYIYFHRDSFQELYNTVVRNGKVTLEMTCNITRYKEGQRDMAQALKVRWWY